MLPSNVETVLADFIPICREMVVGRYAILVGGSLGKGLADKTSDIDLRLFYDELAPQPALASVEQRLADTIRAWEEKGQVVDGCWTRQIGPIEAEVACWLAGEGRPTDIVWTIWGYYLLPDLYHMALVEDPFGVIAGWKATLATYSPKLKAAILAKHLGSLRYWREDYHYRSKVRRQDCVFLAGLTSRLLHDIMQVLFALNETYFVGDGGNLHFAEAFAIVPPRLTERVNGILYPGDDAEALERQYAQLGELIDEVLALALPHRG
jgi:hypothetical protein